MLAGMCRRVLKTFPILDFGTGFVVLKNAASTAEHQLEKAGVLEPPSVCLIILHYKINLCFVMLSVRRSPIYHCAMLLPFKNSCIMLSCTVLWTVCTPLVCHGQGVTAASVELLSVKTCQQAFCV